MKPHTHCSSTFEAKWTFVALCLVLPMLQKFLILAKEWEDYGVFGVRGSMFGDGWIKID